MSRWMDSGVASKRACGIHFAGVDLDTYHNTPFGVDFLDNITFVVNRDTNTFVTKDTTKSPPPTVSSQQNWCPTVDSVRKSFSHGAWLIDLMWVCLDMKKDDETASRPGGQWKGFSSLSSRSREVFGCCACFTSTQPTVTTVVVHGDHLSFSPISSTSGRYRQTMACYSTLLDLNRDSFFWDNFFWVVGYATVNRY